MSVSELLEKKRENLNSLKMMREGVEEHVRECPKCGQQIPLAKLWDSMGICPECSYYFPLSPKRRILSLADSQSFQELFRDLETTNPLDFPDYQAKIAGYQEKTKQKEAFVCGTCQVGGYPIAVGVLDGRFLMGSMGSVVGEKITRLAEYADKKKLPLLIFSASGGARMQEGLFSLMQMAKTAAAIGEFQEHGGFFLSWLNHPTTGGVSASYASLGDLIIAEPDALIGFAGPRVIEQTIGEKLPEGFQHAEFLLEHGMIDLIVPRKKMRETVIRILRMHMSIRK